MSNLRKSKLIGGLVDWLMGGLATRLDFVEHGLGSLQKQTTRIANNQKGMAKVVLAHHQELRQHRTQLQEQTDQMIALRRMHGLLSERLGQTFDNKTCESCHGPLVFNRVAAENAYSLHCPRGCGGRMLLEETMLLNSVQHLLPGTD
ncbi:MAG: hypothetical protein O2968_10615 [Acidobacteria bacterium]|nr:hypothetical protein [Acidobacteriota bacterium]